MPKLYFEKLRDPRWQRKRLEVMQRADFSCESCGTTEVTLNVHHRLYRKGADPWEYALTELACLCEKCHRDEHTSREELAEILASFDIYDIDRVIGYAKSVLLDNAWERELSDEDTIAVRNEEQAMGLADGMNLELCAPEQDLLRHPKLRIRELFALQTVARQRQRLRAEGKE